MVLCAKSGDNVELIQPPKDALLGERVGLEGQDMLQYAPVNFNCQCVNLTKCAHYVLALRFPLTLRAHTFFSMFCCFVVAIFPAGTGECEEEELGVGKVRSGVKH